MIARLIRAALAMMLSASMVAGVPAFAQSAGQSGQSTPSGASSQPSTPMQQQSQAQAPATATGETASSQGSVPLVLDLGSNYSNGKSWFPNIIAPYTPLHLSHAQFVNSTQIDQLIHDGKLMLSLQDAIALALANNVDISVERFIPWIAETDILRTKAGGATRGLSGTGTASVLGSGTAGTFDPTLSSTLLWQRSSIPVNNPFISGTGLSSLEALTNYTAQANVTYSQAFHTGTSFSIAFDNTRGSTTSPAQFFNPYVQSSVIYSMQQPLLNGFGLLPNTRFIIEARNEKFSADSQLSQQVMTTITQVETDYWELVYARENVKVEDAAVATSQKLYDDNRKQVQIGTLAPLEVTRAASQLASDQQNLIVAQTTALQDQTILLNAITKNPLAGGLQGLEVIPTDPIPSPRASDNLTLDQAVSEAWKNRPELQQVNFALKSDAIEVKATRNSLLPIVDLFGQYEASGLGGNLLSTTSTPATFGADLNSPILTASGTPVLINNLPVFAGTPLTYNTTSTTIPGGLGDALQAIYDNNFPTYTVGMNITLSIRNRSAQADAARALLNERQEETVYRQTQNVIILDVRNAMIALQQDRARVDAASKARLLAQETLEADQKKYQLGATTTFQVIQDQRDLTAAQGTEIRAKADLIEAQVNYDKAMGRTLEVNNITLGDAKTGHMYTPPNIPGTPSSQLPGGSQP